MTLSQTSIYQTEQREVNSVLVLKSLPTGVQALVIHQWLLMDNELLVPNVPEKVCLEVTILHKGGMEHEVYTKKLFHLGCIAQFVQRSKQNIVL
jgi:hypothetical protein